MLMKIDLHDQCHNTSESHGNRGSRLTQPDKRNATPAPHPVAEACRRGSRGHPAIPAWLKPQPEPRHAPSWSPTEDATPVPPVGASTAFHCVLSPSPTG